MKSFPELVLRTRSFRRFDQGAPIDLETLRELVDLARQTASASNKQPIKYILVADSKLDAEVFEHTRWAGALSNWSGPAKGERPTGYILMLTDTDIRAEAGTDIGIAAQTIMLAARERGLGGCMLGAIDRGQLRAMFGIPERYKVTLLLALGVPAETVVLESVGDAGDIDYYRDEDDVHHVPKRTLDEVVLQTHG